MHSDPNIIGVWWVNRSAITASGGDGDAEGGPSESVSMASEESCRLETVRDMELTRIRSGGPRQGRGEEDSEPEEEDSENLDALGCIGGSLCSRCAKSESGEGSTITIGKEDVTSGWSMGFEIESCSTEVVAISPCDLGMAMVRVLFVRKQKARVLRN